MGQAVRVNGNTYMYSQVTVKIWTPLRIFGTISLGNSPEKFRKWRELMDKLKVEWEEDTMLYIEKLTDSMPQRIEAAIKAKGGATKYWIKKS